jgi:hypothetical protein
MSAGSIRPIGCRVSNPRRPKHVGAGGAFDSGRRRVILALVIETLDRIADIRPCFQADRIATDAGIGLRRVHLLKRRVETELFDQLAGGLLDEVIVVPAIRHGDRSASVSLLRCESNPGVCRSAIISDRRLSRSNEFLTVPAPAPVADVISDPSTAGMRR